jgi:hypothetical protein
MDRCPLTSPPLQRRGVTTCEDRQEVAKSALVNGIESKMAALIWRAAPGCLRWNCVIFDFACSCVCSSHLPLVITLVIAFPLYQVLKPLVAHPAVQYSLDLILLLTFDMSWGRG